MRDTKAPRKVVGKLGNITRMYYHEYHIWCGVRYRCYHKNNTAYKWYGARGITVCDRWLAPDGFANFIADMGPRPTADHSIERIDVNGPYCPENCKWIPSQEQMLNVRKSVFLEHGGMKMPMAQWARHLGIPIGIIKSRYRRGWSARDILNPVIDKSRGPNSRVVRYKVGDEMLSMPEIHRKTGISIGALRHRLSSGWTVEEAISGQRRPKGSPDAPMPKMGTEA